MTYRELYLEGRRRLKEAGVEDSGTDAALLCEHFFSLDRPRLAMRGGEACPLPQQRAFLQAVGEREERRPLQYILGRWEFMGLELEVGEGVLVPREDTGTLVEALAGRAREKKGAGPLRGIDLCAGTGAVALGLCKLCPGLEMECVELSGEAFPYLEKNLAAYPQYPVKAVKGDVLLPQTAEGYEGLGLIASNPPYIAGGVLGTLQPEVRREPAMALDGGPDGLVFYRALAEIWAPRLKKGGLLGVEIGEEQGEAVMALFRSAGLEKIALYKDWGGLPRAVVGEKA